MEEVPCLVPNVYNVPQLSGTAVETSYLLLYISMRDCSLHRGSSAPIGFTKHERYRSMGESSVLLSTTLDWNGSVFSMYRSEGVRYLGI